MRGRRLACAGLLLLGAASACADGAHAPDRGVLNIDVRTTPERVGELYSSTGSDTEIAATAWIDGTRFTVSLSAAGRTTLYFPKRNLDLEFEGDSFRGIRAYRVSASKIDASMMRMPLGFEVFTRQGMDTPRIEAAALTLNGRYWGLYYLVEKIDEDFFARRGLPVIGLYKADGEANFAAGMSAHVQDFFEAKSDEESFAPLQRLASFVETSPRDAFERAVFSYVDREDAVRYLTASVLTNNWDGFNNNIFLWSPGRGRPLRLLPWDLDRAWTPSPGSTGRVWLDNLLFERIFAIESVRLEVGDRVARALAGPESPERFSERVAAQEQALSRAYADDPALGGMRGWVLHDQAAALLGEYETWKSTLESADGAAKVLGPRP